MTTPLSIAASAVELEVRGRAYRMSPLTIGDHIAHERWIQSRVATLAADASASAERAVQVAGVAATLAFGSDEFRRLSSTREGECRLLFYGIQRNHPAVGFNEFWNGTTDADMDAIRQAFRLVNHHEAKPEADTPPKADAGGSPAPTG